MKFLDNFDHSERSRSIVSFVINMAKYLNLEVIAEGVETLDQFDYLKTACCDNIQGYYYAKPMPSDQFTHFIDDNTLLIEKRTKTLSCFDAERTGNISFLMDSFEKETQGHCLAFAAVLPSGQLDFLSANKRFSLLVPAKTIFFQGPSLMGLSDLDFVIFCHLITSVVEEKEERKIDFNLSIQKKKVAYTFVIDFIGESNFNPVVSLDFFRSK